MYKEVLGNYARPLCGTEAGRVKAEPANEHCRRISLEELGGGM
jgi:hypothetical protein